MYLCSSPVGTVFYIHCMSPISAQCFMIFCFLYQLCVSFVLCIILVHMLCMSYVCLSSYVKCVSCTFSPVQSYFVQWTYCLFVTLHFVCVFCISQIYLCSLFLYLPHFLCHSCVYCGRDLCLSPLYTSVMHVLWTSSRACICPAQVSSLLLSLAYMCFC